MPVLSRPPHAPSDSPPDAAPLPVAPPATPLSYTPPERTVHRRSFRLLWAMTLLNTALILLNFAGGSGWQAVERRWLAWKQARADAVVLRQNLAIQQKALVFRAPADRVIYTEDPAEAARLLAADPVYRAVGRGTGNPPAGWQPPVAAEDPGDAAFLKLARQGGRFRPGGGNPTVSWGPFGNNIASILFLHERTTPGGEKRLVSVSIRSHHSFHDYSRSTPARGSVRVWERTVERVLSGEVWAVSADGSRPDLSDATTLSLLLPDSRRREIGISPLALNDVDPNLASKLDRGDVVRFLAGQPDPADPSRFTLPYVINGRAGVIDGHVSDGGLLLRPREGKSVGDNREAGWELSPAPVPTTAPGRSNPEQK